MPSSREVNISTIFRASFEHSTDACCTEIRTLASFAVNVVLPLSRRGHCRLRAVGDQDDELMLNALSDEL